MTTVATIAEVGFRGMMIIGPSFGYIAQGIEAIRHPERGGEGFCPLVSVILLVSNTIRLVYYLAEPYEAMLFAQAVVMVIIQLSLLMLVMRLVREGDVRDDRAGEGRDGGGRIGWSPIATQTTTSIGSLTSTPTIPPIGGSTPVVSRTGSGTSSRVVTPRSTLSNNSFTPHNAAPGRGKIAELLLKWCSARTCPLVVGVRPGRLLAVYGVLAVLFASLVALLLSSDADGDASPRRRRLSAVLGGVSLGWEGLMGAPQMALNALRQSTQGLSVWLVLTWGVGDSIKVGYFALAASPWPFLLCGGMQVVGDSILLAQMVFYRHRTEWNGLSVGE